MGFMVSEWKKKSIQASIRGPEFVMYYVESKQRQLLFFQLIFKMFFNSLFLLNSTYKACLDQMVY